MATTPIAIASFEDAAAVTTFVKENRLGADCYSTPMPSDWLRNTFVLEGDKLTVSGRGASLTAVVQGNSFFLPPREGSNVSEGINIGHGVAARERMITELMARNPNNFNY